jgi:hypothetical protein
MFVVVSTLATSAHGQDDPATQQPDHQHAQMNMPMTATGWQLMQDGVVYALFNHQGGRRGGDEFVAPNWWMGMLTKTLGSSRLTFNAMLSVDAASVGTSGYRELFQTGEALYGQPLVDRQHPHDFSMQLAAVWRTPLSATAGLTLAGGPAGEAALGPVAFIHRPSAASIPFAPLGHHTFDSTHVSFGVVTAAVDHGEWTLEGSVFNGREPDEHRWDFDFGKMDSVSTRVWYRPTTTWAFQASTGHLVEPEELAHGNIERTTASASWFRASNRDFSAFTIGYGVNATEEASRQAVFGEFTRRVGPKSWAARVEILQAATDELLHDALPATAETAVQHDLMGAVTLGGTRDIVRWRGFEGALGANVTFFVIPSVLQAAYGNHPVSLQIFYQLRLPTGSMGRMWNMLMARPMAGHSPR